MFEVNKIICGDCRKVLKTFPDECIDMIITSPPYDDLRIYKGIEWNFDIFKEIASEFLRIIKEGSVIVWIVNDATINGSETGSSFMQALYFKQLGFKLYDTMIWEKPGSANPPHRRYHQVFEYMFIISKGIPRTFNGIIDRKNKCNHRFGKGTVRLSNGEMKDRKQNKLVYRGIGLRFNVWHANTQTQENVCHENVHPAMFPEPLIRDHIKTWSNEEDLILDPFMGSGTTAVVCEKENRKWLGVEISSEYCEIAEKRIENQRLQFTLQWK